MPTLLKLFLMFLKIGAVSFGGGYGMISILTEDVVSSGLLTEEELLNFIAVAESTPGPIAINMATFVGTSQAGFLGAVLCTLGVVLPAFVIILVIASLIKNLLKFAGVKAFLCGVRPVVVGLILATGLFMFLSVVLGYNKVDKTFNFDYKELIIFAIIVLTSILYKKIRKKNFPTILLTCFSAVLGIIFYGIF